MRRRRSLLLSPFFALSSLALAPTATCAQDAPPAPAPAPAASANVQNAGPLTVEMRAPAAGLEAGKESEITLRVTDSTQGGVPFARIKAEAALSGDPSVRADKLRLRSGSVVGDYLLTARFPKPGDYRLTLQVAPPSSGPAVEASPVLFDVSVRASESGGDRKDEDSQGPYELSVEMDPRRPLALDQVEMTIVIKDRATGQPVKEFDEARQRQLHLFLVREDAAEMVLEQPTLDERTGEFKLRYAFPVGGEWRVWAEVAPKNGGAHLLSKRVRIDGPRPLRQPLMPQLAPQVRDNGMTLTMRPTRLSAGSTEPVPLRLVDGRGGAVTDLQFFDGALAHLYFVDRDAKTLLIARLDESDPRNGRSDTLTFPVRFPKGGVYRGWLQVQRGTVRSLMPFTIRVSDAK